MSCCHAPKRTMVVNHGSRFKGLSIPFAKGSIFDGTGNVVGMLSLLADQEERHTLDPSGFGVTEAALKMGVSKETAVRIVRKLVELRKKQFIYHFRACTIGQRVCCATKSYKGLTVCCSCRSSWTK